MSKKKGIIRLLVIEDNRILRDGMISLLNKYDDIRSMAAPSTNGTILNSLESFKPDILLIDPGLRSQNSLQLVKTAKTNDPLIKIIVMNFIPTQIDVFEFVRAGVRGFIFTDASTVDFLSTIRSVARGENVLPSDLTGSLFSQIVEHAVNETPGISPKLLKSVRMTKREQQVISLVSDGLTNKEIAQRLNLATSTVKSHIHKILEKLAIHTRIQIAKYDTASNSGQIISGATSRKNE